MMAEDAVFRLVLGEQLDEYGGIATNIMKWAGEAFFKRDVQDYFILLYAGDMAVPANLPLDWDAWENGPFNYYSEGSFAQYNIQKGLLIDKLRAQGPAENAGIRRGDLIFSVDGAAVCRNEYFKQAIVQSEGPVTLGVMKGTERVFLEVEPSINQKGVRAVGYAAWDCETTGGIGGLAVTGSLTVEGNVVNENANGGPTLYVGEDLYAKNIIAGGCRLLVGGNVKAQNAFVGFYNDGSIYVDKDVEAAYVACFDHDFHIGGKTRGYRVGDDFARADARPHKFFVDEVQEKDDDDAYVDDELVVKAILEGREIRRKKYIR